MLEALAAKRRANIAYDILTASGLGDACEPQLMQNNSSDDIDLLYSATYRSQFDCGSNDVTDEKRGWRKLHNRHGHVFACILHIARTTAAQSIHNVICAAAQGDTGHVWYGDWYTTYC